MPSRLRIRTGCFVLWVCPQLLSSTSALVTTTASKGTCENLGFQLDEMRTTIAKGHVYQKRHFLTEAEVQNLLEDMTNLEEQGCFQRSGLSNTVKGSQQNFGAADRSTCTVPWWRDALVRSNNDAIPEGRMAVLKLLKLQQVLADSLDRPTVLDSDLAHECYYSRSTAGSFLPRHMDERHEELKGSRGWLLPSRRSLSWLIYLSDPDWDLETHGGALRSFPQQQVQQRPSSSLSTHDGNLQIGWRIHNNADSQPIYLDSWYPVKLPNGEIEAQCILYVVQGDNQQRRDVTIPWQNEGVSVADFVKAHAKTLFLQENDARRFALLEDRTEWDQGQIPRGSEPVDLPPERGSLVVFDSVMVPHEVAITKKGTRIALAGWFHETTQAFPLQHA